MTAHNCWFTEGYSLSVWDKSASRRASAVVTGNLKILTINDCHHSATVTAPPDFDRACNQTIPGPGISTACGAPAAAIAAAMPTGA